MSDLGGAVKAWFERLSTPVMGHYLLILALLNWRLWILLFSGEVAPNERTLLIEDYLGGQVFCKSILWGLLALSLYLFVLPFVIEFVLRIRRKIILKTDLWHETFRARRDEQLRLGGSAEVLATSLKKDLGILADHTRQLIRLLEDCQASPAKIDQNTSQQINKLKVSANARLEEWDKTLTELTGILGSDYGKPTSIHAAEFKRIRER